MLLKMSKDYFFWDTQYRPCGYSDSFDTNSIFPIKTSSYPMSESLRFEKNTNIFNDTNFDEFTATAVTVFVMHIEKFNKHVLEEQA